jgi:hypothetical protein
MSTAVKLRRSSHSTLADLHRDRECGRPSDRSALSRLSGQKDQ